TMAREIDARATSYDYLVGWVDCIAGGRKLGRGIVHAARYLQPGQDPRPADSLNVGAQELPRTILGIFPKALLHHLMGPFINNLGVRLINASKMWSTHLHPQSHIYFQSHGAFAFL